MSQPFLSDVPRQKKIFFLSPVLQDAEQARRNARFVFFFFFFFFFCFFCERLPNFSFSTPRELLIRPRSNKIQNKKQCRDVPPITEHDPCGEWRTFSAVEMNPSKFKSIGGTPLALAILGGGEGVHFHFLQTKLSRQVLCFFPKRTWTNVCFAFNYSEWGKLCCGYICVQILQTNYCNQRSQRVDTGSMKSPHVQVEKLLQYGFLCCENGSPLWRRMENMTVEHSLPTCMPCQKKKKKKKQRKKNKKMTNSCLWSAGRLYGNAEQLNNFWDFNCSHQVFPLLIVCQKCFGFASPEVVHKLWYTPSLHCDTVWRNFSAFWAVLT